MLTAESVLLNEVGFSEGMSEMPSLEDNLGLARQFTLRHARMRHFHTLQIPVEDMEEYSIACEGLLKACSTYRPEVGEFSTYAYMCMRNRMRNELKRKSRRIFAECRNPSDFDLLTEKRNRTTIDVISLFVEKPDETESEKLDRQMLKERFLLNMSMQEIADKYKVTKMRVLQRIKRIIKKIRIEYEQF